MRAIVHLTPSLSLSVIFCLFARRKSDKLLSRRAALADLKEFSPDVWIRKLFIVSLNRESRDLYTKERENHETMMSESSQQTTSLILK